MSAPDVYEELGRLVAEQEGELSPTEWGQRIESLVSFLRWRDAREEWPAMDCECNVAFESPESRVVLIGRLRNGWIDCTEKGLAFIQSDVTRWRYALGACPCQPGAKP